VDGATDTKPAGAAVRVPGRADAFRAVRARLGAGGALRVVFANDIGFMGGAGIALRRQIQSFLLGGHAVAAVCWRAFDGAPPLPPRGAGFSGRWLGLFQSPPLHEDTGLRPAAFLRRAAERVLSLSPDLVIAGNLHGSPWPLALLPALRGAGVPVVAYLHDCHWLTGRCAQPGSCTRFETGCDAACPTPAEYPALAPSRIAEAWAARRAVFSGADAIPLVANSHWTAHMARRAFGGGDISVIHLGVDTMNFAPVGRTAARDLFGLPREGVVAVAGAHFATSRWKGGPLLMEVIGRLARGNALSVIAFGHDSELIEGAHGLGWIDDEEMMPFVYGAADLMLNCSEEESFGQTLLEAASCGLPIVATRTGGVNDVARDGANALLLERGDADGLVAACERLARDPALRHALGRNGRELVEREFTLAFQYAAWRDYLCAAPA